jgi:hypothetical protein
MFTCPDVDRIRDPNGDWRRSIHIRVVADLTLAVVSPAPNGAVRAPRTGVPSAERYLRGGQGASYGNRLGVSRAVFDTLANLTVRVHAPATRSPIALHRTGVAFSSRDRNGIIARAYRAGPTANITTTTARKLGSEFSFTPVFKG